jgi:quaternary ammonium compound-resistance protein SugE
MTSGWVQLIVAGVFEIIWVIGLKLSDGLSRMAPSGVALIAMLFSLYFLSLSIKTLPLGTAYAVWTGIGILGTTLIGIFYFNEPKTALRFLFLFLILAGILGLKLQSKY